MSIDKKKLLKLIELTKPLAMLHLPEDSSVDAVVDQWLHAIATDSPLFCNPQKSDHFVLV